MCPYHSHPTTHWHPEGERAGDGLGGGQQVGTAKVLKADQRRQVDVRIEHRPRDVDVAVRRDKELRIQTLPQEVARARTLLVWRKGHKSTALDAMQAEIKKR